MTYIIREIDNGLWRQMKSKAALDGVTIKAVFVTLIEQYVAGKISITEKAA